MRSVLSNVNLANSQMQSEVEVAWGRAAIQAAVTVVGRLEAVSRHVDVDESTFRVDRCSDFGRDHQNELAGPGFNLGLSLTGRRKVDCRLTGPGRQSELLDLQTAEIKQRLASSKLTLQSQRNIGGKEDAQIHARLATRTPERPELPHTTANHDGSLLLGPVIRDLLGKR